MGKTKREQAEEREYEKARKLGEQNLELLKSADLWCKNFRAEMKSYGLLAQLYQLPIGSIQISCRYSKNTMEGMNLPWILPEFVNKSCDDCKHRIPNGNDSWGMSIINSHKSAIAQRASEEKKYNEKLNQLRRETRKIPQKIKKNSKLDEKQILIYLEEIFDDDSEVREKAADKLIQAAKIGSELFSQLAIEVLISQISQPVFAINCIVICTELAKSRKDISSSLEQAVQVSLEKGINVELCAGVLVALGSTASLSDIAIKNLFSWQYRERLIGSSREPDYPNSIAVLLRILQNEKSRVVKNFKELLLVDDKHIRVNLCKTMDILQGQLPEICNDLLPIFIESLELPDDRYDESADACAMECITTAFIFEPKKVDEYLFDQFLKQPLVIKEEIAKIYKNLIRKEAFDKTNHEVEEVGIAVGLALKRCLQIIRDENMDLSVRDEAASTLSLVKYLQSIDKKECFNSLLGFYAMIVSQETPPELRKLWTPDDMHQTKELKALNKQNEQFLWSGFKNKIEGCLDNLAENIESNDICDDLIKTFESLNSKDHEKFKGRLTLLLGSSGKSFNNLPKVLPVIMKSVADFSSTLGRHYGLRALSDIYRYRSVKPPENVIDIAIVHLFDQYVGVHKAAADFIEKVSWALNDNQRLEAFNGVANLIRVYKSEDLYYLKDLFSCLILVAKNNPKLKRITVMMAESIFPTKEMYVDVDIAKNFMYAFRDEYPNPIIDMVLDYLLRYSSDRYNGYENSDREKFTKWLINMPGATFVKRKNDLLKCGLTIAKKDAWESTIIAALFNKFEDFESEASILKVAAETTGKENQTLNFSKKLMSMSYAANINKQIKDKNLDLAKELLAQIEKEKSNEKPIP